MARESLKNVGESVRARLLQRSRDERTDFQVLLTRYALERLLYRLSQSAHRHRFVLKGAMLFATWVKAPFRPTRDLDLLGYEENSPEAIREAFREICGQAVADDGVAFDVDRIDATPIREDLEYGGVYASAPAQRSPPPVFPFRLMSALGMRSLQVLLRSTILHCSTHRHLTCALIRRDGGGGEVPCTGHPRYHQ